MDHGLLRESEAEGFTDPPSKPRARLMARLLILLALLALACCAIWWIDRGVAMTNGHG